MMITKFNEYRGTFTTSLFALFVLLVCCQVSHAQSLWEKRDRFKTNVYQDLKAMQVGDLLTVVVSENTGFNHQDTRGLNKSTSASNGFDLSYGAGGGFGTATGNTSFGANSSSGRQFDGDTNASTSRQFTDRFTVQVIDVLPNGNLLVSGTREIDVQGDTRKLTLSGIVRGRDIFGDNTINSRLVANLSMKYDGKGPEQKFIKQGWLGRRMNKIWPY